MQLRFSRFFVSRSTSRSFTSPSSYKYFSQQHFYSIICNQFINTYLEQLVLGIAQQLRRGIVHVFKKQAFVRNKNRIFRQLKNAAVLAFVGPQSFQVGSALQRITNATLQLIRIQFRFDEVIRGTHLHGFNIHFFIAFTREQHDGFFTAQLYGLFQKIETRFCTQPVINKIEVVTVRFQVLYGISKAVAPIYFQVVFFNLAQVF